MTYEFWQHTVVGDIFAVAIENGKAVFASSSLHHADIEKSDPSDFDMTGVDGEWIENHKENFRLYEQK